MSSYFADIKELGRDLFVSGLITSHGGNVSVLDKSGETIHITRSGSALGRLRAGDVVEVGFDLPGEDCAALAADNQASIELIVHRALYHAVAGTKAIVHAHSLFTTLLSLRQDSIEPIDSESKHFISRVPVLDVEETIASHQVAELLPQMINDSGCPVAVVRGHGPFAVGKDLDEAWRYISILEMSSRMIHEYNR
jgi:L-fuculose-phosphate aldolase